MYILNKPMNEESLGGCQTYISLRSQEEDKSWNTEFRHPETEGDRQSRRSLH